ncbi:MAG: monovalent cation/H+ antiporter subunit D family protein [Proteobacteria bacterium]|nr:monovalent cation/H+ antiporter subunit D family protein [Pseudomonadota bacterium]
MSPGGWLLVAILLSSLLPGAAIFFLPEERQAIRTTLNLAGAASKLCLVGVLLWGVFRERAFEARLPFLPGHDLALRADALSVLFVSLSAGLWFLTTLYAVGYLERSPHRSRFFGFFSLCVTATVGVALAGNLVTFLLFYELLTLATYPLVVHRGTETALRAGRVYLAYTLAGGAVLLVAVVWLHTLAGPFDFREAGALSGTAAGHGAALTAIFGLLVLGVGVKAALVPLHGWLPTAMVAPAPVSALLHAVAVVKAGAFGIVRLVYNVYGVELAAGLGVLGPLAALAALTIVYGSLRALVQSDLKRRLAFSTVSQVSYIVLGVATVGPLATIGGVAHLVHQGLMKITLFFCAGNLAETLGIHRVSEMNGVGRRLPWTMAAFTVAAFGMIGVPPMAGFVSKWYLGLGALEAHMPWVLGVLVASSLLNAAYFLPILHAAWFKPQQGPWPAETPRARFETDWRLLLPPLVTALLTVATGLLAATPFSPLDWARLIAVRAYLR